MTSYARTTSGRYLGSLYSDEETDREQREQREQRTSVPVVFDDSDVHAIIDDVESRPHTAESAPAITSKSSTIADKSSVNPPRNMDTGDVTSVRSQPIPSHDDPAASPQGGTAKTPPRRAQSLSATSHTASHRQETSVSTDIPSVSVISSTPVSPTAPESFGRPPPQEDRIPPTGRSTPVNDRDHRQSRRRSVMDVSLVPFFWDPHGLAHPIDFEVSTIETGIAKAVVQCSYRLSHTHRECAAVIGPSTLSEGGTARTSTPCSLTETVAHTCCLFRTS